MDQAMTDVTPKNTEKTTENKTKKAHVTLVKPMKIMGRDPGVGCRPTGVQ
ncbi:MAG: hypothetical protein ACK5P7_10775 [Bdellovibrio sp.]